MAIIFFLLSAVVAVSLKLTDPGKLHITKRQFCLSLSAVFIEIAFVLGFIFHLLSNQPS